MTLRQISPTPYLAHDTPLQGGIAGFASAYVGNTAFTYYNALYRTQLPSGLFAPATMGTPSKQGSFVAGKGLPVTLFNGSAYAGMDISLNALGDINSAILGYTVAFESAGFELGGGTYVTQRMLASHFADDNGESWTSVFGNADSATVSEMSEQELVAYIANKRYANDEWRSGLVKLSTKGLLTEYLNAKAETNYLLEKIAEQEMKLMAQEALLARVRMNHKDKELESLTEAINVGVAPDFIKAELEKKGDEWIESEVQTGGFGGEINGFSSGYTDTSPLPEDLEQIKKALLEVIFLGESANNDKGWNASNNGTIKNQIVCSRGNGGVWNLTNMTLAEMKKVYRYGGHNSPKHLNDCSRLFAAGRFQMIFSTFNYAQTTAKIPDSAKFTPETQTKMAEAILMNRIGGFFTGRKSLNQAKIALSQEWASLGLPNQTCNTKTNRIKGWHGGANGAKCDVTFKVWALLEQAEKIKNKK